MNPDDLEIALQADNKVKVSGADIDGTSRGKFMAKSKFLKSIAGGFGMDRYGERTQRHPKAYVFF